MRHGSCADFTHDRHRPHNHQSFLRQMREPALSHSWQDKIPRTRNGEASVIDKHRKLR